MCQVTIGDSSGGLTVRLPNALGALDDAGRLEVTLHHNGLVARTTLWDLSPHHFADLATFFAGMAQERRGWNGEKQYDSLEQELTLRARHTGSRVEIETRLRQSGALGADWHVAATFSIDAGEQLASAASELDAMFDP